MRIILLAFILSFATYSWAAPLTSDLADYLFTTGNYPAAITEYQRCLLDTSASSFTDTLAMRCKLQITKCYYRSGQYIATVGYAEGILAAEVVDSALRAELLRYKGLSCLKAGFPELAIQQFQGFDGAPSRILQSYACMLSGDYSMGRSLVKPLMVSQDESARGLSLRFDTTFAELDRLKLKKPTVAAILSGVIPGAGYLYTGYYQTAVSSLFLNSLLIATSYELAKHGFKYTSGFATLVTFGWYFGNIMGSYKSAIKTNERSREVVRQRLLGDVPLLE